MSDVQQLHPHPQTQCGFGDGRGLALRFAEPGNRVIVGGRRQRLLEEMADQHEAIDAVPVDTTDPEPIHSVAPDVRARFPQTNALIPMAGIMRPEDVHDGRFLDTAGATVAASARAIRLWAAFSAFLAAEDTATLIRVSSGLGFTPLPLTPTYDATRAAVHVLTAA